MEGKIEGAKEVIFEICESKWSSILGQCVNHQMSAMKKDEFKIALIARETLSPNFN